MGISSSSLICYLGMPYDYDNSLNFAKKKNTLSNFFIWTGFFETWFELGSYCWPSKQFYWGIPLALPSVVTTHDYWENVTILYKTKNIMRKNGLKASTYFLLLLNPT